MKEHVLDWSPLLTNPWALSQDPKNWGGRALLVCKEEEEEDNELFDTQPSLLQVPCLVKRGGNWKKCRADCSVLWEGTQTRQRCPFSYQGASEIQNNDKYSTHGTTKHTIISLQWNKFNERDCKNFLDNGSHRRQCMFFILTKHWKV